MNAAPVIQVPSGLAGTVPSYSFVLATASNQSLQFAATDPDGDTLQWVVSADAQAGAAGISYSSPVAGGTFVLTINGVAGPVASTVTLLVEDPRGGAAAIDILVVRAGAPTITGVTPTSAFAGKPQQVEVAGTALRLGGAVTTNVRFDGVLGTGTVVDSDTKVRTTTPLTVNAGTTIVAVDHIYGSAALPGSAFTMFVYPPSFALTDQRLDATVAAEHDLALDGKNAHAVWLETGVVHHRTSIDGGASWTAAQSLSGAESATDPHVVVNGDDVLVAWIGDGNAVRARRSTDGGTTFAPVVRLDAMTLAVNRLRICGKSTRRHAAWISGSGSAARLVAAGSTDSGATWSAQVTVDDGAQPQSEHSIVTNGVVTHVVFLDERVAPTARGVYVSRSVGGVSWSTARRLSQPGVVSTEPCITALGSRAHVAWVQGGSLYYGGSIDSGATWTSAPFEVRSVASGAITGPAIACEVDRVVVGYIQAGTTAQVSRFSGAGSVVNHVQVDGAAAADAQMNVGCIGSYVFAAWREGAVGDGSARVKVCASTDGGAVFNAAAGVGNGIAAQDQPKMGFDGARLLLGWLDSRDPSVGLYVNRTAQ